MNQSLLKTERYLDGLASLSKSAIGWFDQCKQRATDHTASQDSENSFHLFLRIIAAQFGKLEGSDKLQGWRQIKGRLYSKFHSRSMQELNSNGLSQFISLFLILAQKVDLTDVSHKMVDLLDMLLMDSSLSRSKQQIIYKGLFTLCLVLQERQVDMSFVADKLSSGFDTICRELSQTDMDIGERHQIWTLITLYTDSTQDVFDNSSDNLSLSEEKLIGSGFKHLLPACNESEIRVMLQFTLNLMACQSVYKRMYRSEGKHVPKAKIKDLIQRLWNNFYSFVKSSSSNSKPNCLLADVAASFTMLASDMEDNLTEPQEKMLDIFNYFGVADTSVHFSISLRYLCHLLPNTALMQKVEKHYGEAYQPTLIHAWVRCSILTNQNADELQEFTRLIYKLPAMTTILGNRAQLPDTNEPEFSQFVRCLGQRFASAKNLQEKIQFRKETLQLFGDLVKLIQFSLKKSSAAEAELKWLYRAIGYIVRDCAPVLYVQSKPHQSQLPGLISELLLPPLIFNPNKTLPTNMLSAIRDTLNLFLEGLSTLDFHKDGFIRQKMQEIVQQYFIRFAIKSSLMPNSNSVTANHPLLVTLYPSQRHNPTPHMRKLRQFVIEVLRSRFIALKGQQAPSQAANALQFVHELFTRTSLANETAKNAAPLLDTILNYLLMCDNGGLKRQASQILVIMMQACKSSADKNINKDLSSILQKFVDRNLQVHQSSTFQVLESVAALYPLPMYDMIPYLNELLAKCEMKRGAGTDNRIRRTYKSLLGHLGSGGEVVIQQIEQGREVLEY
ncbi:protein MMS22-like isoform X2 [Antedon mediterranea]|uniref:protein MMS22-like isoform X2 n=1 Tax=Antedon mediterranea TaxID=105859 RepID=UPI003AF62075